MHGCVFCTADIAVNRAHPVDLLAVEGGLVVFIIHKAEHIPGRADKSIQCVRVTPGGSTAEGTAGVDYVLSFCLRRFAVRREFNIIRQLFRQLILGFGLSSAFVAVDNRNGSAPVALTGNQPVS